MRAINVDTLEWFQVTFGADKQKAILILKPHINNLNIIDAEPVRLGKWNYIDWGVAVCSMCKKRGFKRDYHGNDLPTKYCPNCGAKMDLED